MKISILQAQGKTVDDVVDGKAQWTILTRNK